MSPKSDLITRKHDNLEELFKKHGFTDFKWIDPKKIVVSQWVRMKCIFGCGDYSKNASCPPNVPTVYECERFFSEYNDAFVFHFQKRVGRPEDRHVWSKKVDSDLLKLEREVFISGYERAFLLCMDSCHLCSDCSGERYKCKNLKSSRPSVEAMAVDVYTTVREVGYSIHVLSDYSQTMNRYAFLMIQ